MARGPRFLRGRTVSSSSANNLVPSESTGNISLPDTVPPTVQGDVMGWVLARDKRPLPNPTPDQVREKMGRAFLVQLNITHAGMALGCSAYTGMLDSLAEAGKLPHFISYTMWIFSTIVATVIFSLQILRAFRYPHLLKRDFTSNKLTSFFASPAIVVSTLALSLPIRFKQSLHTGLSMRILFYALLIYQFCLALYWYGDWLFATGYSLRRVHATFFMATTEFFILGALGALVQEDNLAKMSLNTGILFWLLVFVAVFAFLSKTLADEGEKASPTMFLFIAPPATAAIAHMDLQKNIGAEQMDDFTWFFVAVTFFIYLLLMRVFRQYWTRRFSITWWAYIFPLSTAANLATIVARELQETFPWIIAFVAAGIATTMIVVVVLLTLRNIAQGNIPRDETSIRAHYQRIMDSEWTARKVSMDPDGTFEIGTDTDGGPHAV